MNFSLEHAQNTGSIIFNSAPCENEATIAVTGMGRSGTTMIARILDAFGLFMGEPLSPQFMEDQRILDLIRTDQFDDLAALCRERDKTCAKWAFKCPALRGKLNHVHPLLRAPRYIVPFRDIAAISLRHNLALSTELKEALGLAARGYTKLLSALENIDAPVLLLSYEKALQYPDLTVQTLADFCGVTLPPSAVKRIAAQSIRNGDPRYLAKDDPGEPERKARLFPALRLFCRWVCDRNKNSTHK